MNYQDAISESIDDLVQLERETKDLKARDRVRFVRLLKTKQAATQKEAGTLIGVGARQSQRLWRQYRESGLARMSLNHYQGGAAKLDQSAQAQLGERLKDDDIQSLERAQRLLREDFSVDYTISGVSYLFRRLGVKLKTGRPRNVTQSAEEREEFAKKNTRN